MWEKKGVGGMCLKPKDKIAGFCIQWGMSLCLCIIWLVFKDWKFWLELWQFSWNCVHVCDVMFLKIISIMLLTLILFGFNYNTWVKKYLFICFHWLAGPLLSSTSLSEKYQLVLAGWGISLCAQNWFGVCLGSAFFAKIENFLLKVL